MNTLQWSFYKGVNDFAYINVSKQLSSTFPELEKRQML
jgi:hypothetical protein